MYVRILRIIMRASREVRRKYVIKSGILNGYFSLACTIVVRWLKVRIHAL